jgi:PAS domain S-box-containing protein
MHQVFTPFRVLAAMAAILLLIGAVYVLADRADPGDSSPPLPHLRVLVLSESRRLDPWYEISLHSFRESMREHHGRSVSLEWDPVNMERYYEPTQRGDVLREFAANHPGPQPDLVLTLDTAAVFALQQKERFFPHTPVVATAVRPAVLQGIHQPEGCTAVMQEIAPLETVQTALDLFPDLERVAVVVGSSPLERHLSRRLHQDLEYMAGRLELVWLEDMAFEDVRARLAELPPRSAVLFGRLTRDSQGRWFVSREGVGELARATDAPVFVLWGTLLGTGALGGVLMDPVVEGRVTATKAHLMLAGRPAPPGTLPAMPIFDWRVMQRFGLEPADLPREAMVRNRPPTMWQVYMEEILLALAVILVLAFTVASLVLINVRRRRVEERLAARAEELRRSEERQTRERRFLETLLDHAQACIAVMAGEELRFTMVNPAYQALRPDMPMQGRTYEEVFPGATASGAAHLVRTVMRTGESHEDYGYPVPIPGKPDAAWDQHMVRLPPGTDGEPAVLVITWDVTEHKRTVQALRESEERFRTLADNISQLAWMADDHGRIFWYNKRWFEYTGTTPEEVRGWGWRTVIHSDHVEDVAEKIRQSFAAGTAWEDTFPMRRHDGEYRWFLSRAVPIRDGQGRIQRWFGTNTDITEIRELQQSLERAKEQAEAANKAKSAFLANMSHEIRTPLNGVLGMTELAMRRATDEKSREFLRLSRQSGRQLLEIINGILDLSKIESGRAELSREEVDVRDVVDTLVKAMEVTAGKRGVALEQDVAHDVPARVWADGGRLRQVLTNLIGNAEKFTEQGRIDVRVRCRERVERNGEDIAVLLFSVRDTGMGIPVDKQEEIFESFAQAHTSADQRFGGTGLGLPISRSLVELMGGRMGVESEPGRGSTFWFRVPFAVAAEHAENHEDAEVQQQNHGPLRVLLVEDDAVNMEVARELLRYRSHRVDAARDGEQALERLRNTRYDVVLMDIRMPGMGGEEAVRRIRAGEAGDPDVPIVAMTAHALRGDRDRFLSEGMDDYLSKPVVLEELDRVLERFSD